MPSSASTASSALSDSLSAYLENVLPGWRHPTSIKKFETGQSNPTYCLTSSVADGAAVQPSSRTPTSGSRASSEGTSPASSSPEKTLVRQVVLRAKPKGKILDRTAHRVDREFGLLRAISEHQARTGHEAVKVPKVFALCEDEAVFGSVFYLMEYLQGRIFVSVLLPTVEPSTRRAYWEAAMRSLGRLASIPPSILPPALFPPSTTPFFARQVGTLLRVSGAQSAVKNVGEIVRDAGEREEVLTFLKEGAQVVDRWEDGRKAIVWGDAKLDNIIYADDEPKVVGLLDWELCAIGSPLGDLGNMLLPWSLSNANVPEQMRRNLLIPLADAETQREHSLPSRDELLDLWLASMFSDASASSLRTKRAELEQAMEWIEIWILYRLAIIAQGIQARVVLGQASSAAASETGSREVVGLLGKVCVQKIHALRTVGRWPREEEKARL